jgi:chromosome segregation ATPase
MKLNEEKSQTKVKVEEVADIKQALSRVQEDNRNLAERLIQMEGERDQAVVDKNQLRTGLRNAESELQLASQQLDSLMSELVNYKKLEQQYSRLLDAQKKKEEDMKNLELNISARDAEIEKLRDQIEYQQKEIENLNSLKNNQRNDLKEAQSEILRKEAIIDQLKSQSSQKDVEVDKLTNQNEMLLRDIQAFASQRQTLGNELKDAQSMVARKDAQVESMKQTIAELKDAQNKLIDDLQHEKRLNVDTAFAMNDQREKMEIQLTRMYAEVDMKAQELDSVKKSAKIREERLKERDGQIQLLSTEIESKDDKIRDMESQMQALLSDIRLKANTENL